MFGVHFVFYLALYSLNPAGQAKSLSGELRECTNEGEKVKVDLVASNPCYSCFCRNGRVECESEKCLSLDGCHAILFTRPSDACCDQCKGCLSNGTQIPHGQVWPALEDPCQVNMCQAGVLTTTREICRPLCSNPVPVPGQCCPSCSGCVYNKAHYMSGEQFSTADDPGVTCTCKAGNVTCAKRPCPVLNCPQESTYQVEGEACPRCKGQRVVFSLLKSCYFAKEVYSEGDVVVVDSCTSCVCQQGTMSCERTQCPDPDCPASQLKALPGECCPRCQKQTLICKWNGVTRQDGEVWHEKCQKCTCSEGRVRCQTKNCGPLKRCPNGQLPSIDKDPCCLTCNTEESSCHVRGKNFDRFKTFDGLRYRLKGACMYELARDCTQDKFKIRIRYVHGVNRQSTIDLVLITLGTTKVKLYKDMKIRVNRTRLASYSSATLQTFDIVVKPPMVTVRDKTLGVKVTWNVLKRLTVKADKRFVDRGRLCGLCGDLNGVRGDDFSNSKGEMVLTSKQMAYAWRRGGVCGKKGSVNLHRKQNRKDTISLLSTGNSQDLDSTIIDLSHSNTRVDNKRPKFDDPSGRIQRVSFSKLRKRRKHKGGQMPSQYNGLPLRQKILTSRNIFNQLKESLISSQPTDSESRTPAMIRPEGQKSNDVSTSSQVKPIPKTSLHNETDASNTDADNNKNKTVSELFPTITDETHQENYVHNIIKINESTTDTADLTLVEKEASQLISSKDIGVGTKSESIRERQSKKNIIPCARNSLDWANAQDECRRIRNWMFFTCAGSMNVGLMTSKCVERICRCHGEESCQKKVISKHVSSCQPLLDTGQNTDDSASSSLEEGHDFSGDVNSDVVGDVDDTNGRHNLENDNR